MVYPLATITHAVVPRLTSSRTTVPGVARTRACRLGFAPPQAITCHRSTIPNPAPREPRLNSKCATSKTSAVRLIELFCRAVGVYSPLALALATRHSPLATRHSPPTNPTTINHQLLTSKPGLVARENFGDGKALGGVEPLVSFRRLRAVSTSVRR